MKPSYTKDRDALLARLNRIEGQVRGVSRMVTEDAYCIDVLTQINAIKAAIDQVGFLLLEDHIKGCVAGSVRQGDDSKVNELVKAVERFARA
ncbi:MAG TPA: metal-sensitive transcriptional regulator [Candidatus Limnocylindrales bacterium]|nr:metal-sensitive transcriptional regulator [Candidatus Limnocylindrales bacterium]